MKMSWILNGFGQPKTHTAQKKLIWNSFRLVPPCPISQIRWVQSFRSVNSFKFLFY